jgi:hypothetical protein
MRETYTAIDTMAEELLTQFVNGNWARVHEIVNQMSSCAMLLVAVTSLVTSKLDSRSKELCSSWIGWVVRRGAVDYEKQLKTSAVLCALKTEL